MIQTETTRPFVVTLVGNPNTGKSSLFNALSGLNQRIGNYPGVTVEKRIGRLSIGNRRIEIVDLPGTYSLAVRSADEQIALDVLTGRRGQPKPDAIICVVDANNLERNLFLVSQLLHLNRPLLVALNMVDIARRNDVEIDVVELSRRLGVPVVAVQANKRLGIADLKKQIDRLVSWTNVPSCPSVFPENFVEASQEVARCLPNEQADSSCFIAQRLLLDPSDEMLERIGPNEALKQEVARQKQRLSDQGLALSSVEAVGRYRWIEQLLNGIVRRPLQRTTISDRIDSVLTHRVWGLLIFAAVMLFVFQAVFSWAEPLMAGIEVAFNRLKDLIGGILPEGAFSSLVTDGVIAGVGGVVVFLPQILILFFFIAVLEDCGYLARASYLLDRLMTRVGLSGKSFIPLLSSFACAIPGIMATRIIENRRDRLITILVAPLMSCSARLPVYTLLISAFIPARRVVWGLISLPALTLLSMYVLGIVAAVGVALVLRRTLLRGATPPFVMELPEYKRPSLRLALARMWDRGWAFIARAGTVIVSVSILIWAAAYFPRNHGTDSDAVRSLDQQIIALQGSGAADSSADSRIAGLQQDRERTIVGEQMRQSYLGRAGRFVEPAVRPLGWDWKIASAVIASFPAREVVVAALSVIYSLGDDPEASAESLREKLHQAKWDGTEQPIYNIPVALSLLVFFSLCAQCVSTLVVIRRETNSWGWPAFSFVYMTSLAYFGALMTYQIGMRFF
jgi:ferrous iron transport protein B